MLGDSSVSMLDSITDLSRDTARGLNQRPMVLPSKYLYDALGSRLFESICELPWYKITKAEHRLLKKYSAEIMSGVADYSTLIELGSGNGSKLFSLLSNLDVEPEEVHLVDISELALHQASVNLSSFQNIKLTKHMVGYYEGLKDALDSTKANTPALVMFLGSNIGNMQPDESYDFVSNIRMHCRLGDRFLVGADLVKDENELKLAYDDPLKITSAFNKNVLLRLNRELNADFDLDLFTYVTIWNAQESRMEAYLVSLSNQSVTIPGAECSVAFNKGDRILTEYAYKYSPDGVVEIGERAGFTCLSQWIEEDSKFSLTLFEN
ncbi:MAG: L-histidine N(alpha)-methyltransferase [Rhodospirillaceae bacterium]|nr:L-histidine N(alpha)-methyltransferase [Rhodospirillaceae bacterium]